MIRPMNIQLPDSDDEITPEAITARTAVMVRGDKGGEELLAAFVTTLKAEGVKVGGVYQISDYGNCDCREMYLIDARNNERIRISQDLGRNSDSCILDPDGLAVGAVRVRAALDEGCDLLVINKFSSREVDGRGLAPELFDAMSRGIPVLVTLAERFLPQWRDHSGDLGTLLPPDMDALRAWWRTLHSPS